MNRLLTTTATALATSVVLSVWLAAPAAADVASPRASCAGLALSDHAVHDGPGAIADSVALLRDVRGIFGFTSNGQVISRWAAAHAGTHAPGCEAALMSVLTGGPSSGR